MLTFGGQGTSTQEIEEEVVTCKLYLGLAFIIPTLERVTTRCCEVGTGVVVGVDVVCGEGVNSEDGDVKVSVSAMIVRVPEKDRWWGRRLRRQRVKGIDHPCYHNEEGFDRSESSDDEDVNDEGSQSRYIVTSDNDVERISKSSYSGDDLKYPSSFKPSMIKMDEVNEKEKWAASNKVNDLVNSTSNKLEEPIPKGKLTSNDSVSSKKFTWEV
nr:hypothetical protein [Tanacetum cinerariifolium]